MLAGRFRDDMCKTNAWLNEDRSRPNRDLAQCAPISSDRDAIKFWCFEVEPRWRSHRHLPGVHPSTMKGCLRASRQSEICRPHFRHREIAARARCCRGADAADACEREAGRYTDSRRSVVYFDLGQRRRKPRKIFERLSVACAAAFDPSAFAVATCCRDPKIGAIDRKSGLLVVGIDFGDDKSPFDGGFVELPARRIVGQRHIGPDNHTAKVRSLLCGRRRARHGYKNKHMQQTQPNHARHAHPRSLSAA